jgi:hypothetical protein
MFSNPSFHLKFQNSFALSTATFSPTLNYAQRSSQINARLQYVPSFLRTHFLTTFSSLRSPGLLSSDFKDYVGRCKRCICEHPSICIFDNCLKILLSFIKLTCIHGITTALTFFLRHLPSLSLLNAYTFDFHNYKSFFYHSY